MEYGAGGSQQSVVGQKMNHENTKSKKHEMFRVIFRDFSYSYRGAVYLNPFTLYLISIMYILSILSNLSLPDY
jgi:hypothetical protein